MKPTGRILLQIVLLSALAIGLNPGTAGAQSSFDGFKPEDYIAVTDRYKLPPPANTPRPATLSRCQRFAQDCGEAVHRFGPVGGLAAMPPASRRIPPPGE